jgi:sn-glycerol 3-phosphate transport system permease protein
VWKWVTFCASPSPSAAERTASDRWFGFAMSIAALFVIQFIYGWNQYLWPLMVTTKQSYYTVVMSISRMVNAVDVAPSWNLIMATAMLAMIPPVIVVLAMQRWFVKGLVETEK